jgi:hypothetical protein
VKNVEDISLDAAFENNNLIGLINLFEEMEEK